MEAREKSVKTMSRPILYLGEKRFEGSVGAFEARLMLLQHRDLCVAVIKLICKVGGGFGLHRSHIPGLGWVGLPGWLVRQATVGRLSDWH